MEPYFAADGVALYHGDCREILPELPGGDLVLTDPPYGETALGWDLLVREWPTLIRAPQVWAFGSLRFWFDAAPAFLETGWRFAQEVVWEKHNGSSFRSDRFKRVHELALHFYRGEWGELYRDVPVTMDATKRRVYSRAPSKHLNPIASQGFESEDGGPRLMRSVQYVRSCHGRALHPTQKPEGIVWPLLQHSCPEGGLVIDPFAGSGTTLAVARRHGRRAIGIEREERYCEIVADRLAQGVFEW